MDPWSWLLGQDFYHLWVHDSTLVHYCIELSRTIMDPVNTISCSIGHDFFVLVGPSFYMRFFKVEKKKLVYNSGPVHYFTLDFIPCVLSWTIFMVQYSPKTFFTPLWKISCRIKDPQGQKIMSYRARYYVNWVHDCTWGFNATVIQV